MGWGEPRDLLRLTLGGGVGLAVGGLLDVPAMWHTGTYERGSGTVSPAGDVSLRGACQGNATCDVEYRGQLTGSPIRLTGTQRRRTRERDATRDCNIELAPKS